MSEYITLENRQHLLMDNALVLGQQEMDISEALIVRLAILQIGQEDKYVREYKIKITDLALILEINKKQLYREIRNICKTLMTRVIFVADSSDPEKPWEAYHWISNAKYDKNGIVTIKLSEEIERFVCDLNLFYTQYTFQEIIPLKPFSTVRLYEIITLHFNKSHKRQYVWEFDVDDLRIWLLKKNKKGEYPNNNRLKEVIKKAVETINANTSLQLDFEPIRVGREYKTVRFTIRPQKILMENLGIENPDDPNYMDIVAIQSLLKGVGLDYEYEIAQTVFKAYGSDLKKLMNNIMYVTKRKDIAKPIGYLLSIKDETPSLDDLHEKQNQTKGKSYKKKKVMPKDEELSEERKQAYLDMEPSHAVDFYQEYDLCTEDE